MARYLWFGRTPWLDAAVPDRAKGWEKLNARFAVEKQDSFMWIQLRSQEAVKNFIIAAVCLSGTLTSNAPGKDKKHVQAAQHATAYQGTILRFPYGTGAIFSIGPFPIILPPFAIREAL